MQVQDQITHEMLEWQINARFRIQKLLHRMHILHSRNTEIPRHYKRTLTEEEKDEWYPINRMIGAAFSLWRSAFLTQASNDRKQIYEHTNEFISKVIAQNSIAFPDDYKMCELTVVYYNTNARYRLERLMDKNSSLVAKYESVRKIDELKHSDQSEHLSPKDLWEILYWALEDCFNDYETTYSR